MLVHTLAPRLRQRLGLGCAIYVNHLPVTEDTVHAEDAKV